MGGMKSGRGLSAHATPLRSKQSRARVRVRYSFMDITDGEATAMHQEQQPFATFLVLGTCWVREYECTEGALMLFEGGFYQRALVPFGLFPHSNARPQEWHCQRVGVWLMSQIMTPFPHGTLFVQSHCGMKRESVLRNCNYPHTTHGGS